MQKPKLLYVYDPLCGWCYGFSPVIRQLEKHYDGQVDFEVLSGGMVLGDRVGPIGDMKDYLKKAIPQLENTTGVRMGLPYMEMLEEGNRILNSELPCIALTAFKSMSKQSQVQFASAIQTKCYQQGRDLSDFSVYKELCDEYNLPWEVFSDKLKSEQYKLRTYEEFRYVQQMGIQGFPSVAMFAHEKGYLLARGYRNFEEMKESIEMILAELSAS